MEENKKPFRLRMNLFDGIVLVIILAVGTITEIERRDEA